MLVESTADIKVEIEAITNTDRKITLDYPVDDIPCVYHHYSDIPDEMSDEEYERCYEEAQLWLEDNLTLYDLTGYAIENNWIEEDEEIIEWTFVKY